MKKEALHIVMAFAAFVDDANEQLEAGARLVILEGQEQHSCLIEDVCWYFQQAGWTIDQVEVYRQEETFLACIPMQAEHMSRHAP